MNIELLKDIVDYGVIGILGLMSFLSIFFYIERLMFFKKIDLSSYKEKQKLEIEDLKEQNNTLQTQMSKIDFSMFHEIEDIKHESKSLHKKYKKLKHKYLSSKNNTKV